MVKNKCWRNGLCISWILIMNKLTPELEKKIKESGIPIIEITLEQLQQATVIKNFNINKHKNQKNNGNTSNR